MTPGPNLSPVAAMLGGSAKPSGPTGLAALLAKPGLRDALLATGTALLAQSDTGASLGGALGQALPMGLQAFRQGQQEASINEAISNAPPEMQQLLRALPSSERVPALLGMMRKPEPVKLGANERLVSADGEEIVGALPQSDDFEYRQVGNTIAVLKDGQLMDRFEFEGAPEERFGDANTLRTQFNSKIQAFDTAAEAFRKVETAGTKANPSAADDLALIFGFMKTMDPGSVVREGEFATAQNAAGVPDRIRNLYNNIINGERLNPEQRKEFVQSAREQVSSQLPLYEARADFYRGIAEREGLNPEDIIRNPFRGLNLSGTTPTESAPGQVVENRAATPEGEALLRMVEMMGGG